MKNTIAKVVYLLIFSTLITNISAAQDAKKLVVEADKHRGMQGSHSVRVKVTVHDGSDVQEQAYTVKIRDPETSLVEQVSPEKAQGRKLLMKGLDMWLFTPQVKKSVRIGLQQRLTGDVANGDISRTHYAADYKATIVGEDKKLKATIMDLVATDDRATYQKIKYWVNPKTFEPIKSEFYAVSGKLMKTATFSGFKKIKGVNIATKVTIQDAVVAKKKSILLYSNHKAEDFPDSIFNKEQMDR